MKELEFLIYNNDIEKIRINAKIENDTIWLTQKSMSELFGVNIPSISKHLNNI